MDSQKRPNVFDVRWTEIYREVSSDSSPTGFNMGGITFRQNKRRSKIKGLLKGVAFVLIASISGAVSGAVVAEKNYSKLDSAPGNKYYDFSDTDYYTRVSIPKNSVTRVAEIAGPAVVGIGNSAEGFLGQFYNKFSGSGIIFREDGYIVTNYHVIEGSDKVLVKLASGNSKPLNAKVVGYDKISDLAILKIDGENLTAARFGDSAKVKVGDVAIAIGNPLGEEFAGSVTAGIISATNRRIEIIDQTTRQKTVYKVFQTDAAINPGNSGGPLCNEVGEVIGMTSLKIGSNQNAEGMGFAISINEVKHVITALMNEGKVRRPFLGVGGGTAIPENNNGVYGVYVREVYEGSPAAEAGIKHTDIIVELGGEKITKLDELSAVIEKHKVGDTIPCKVWRSGKTIEVKVTLKEQR